MYLIRLIVLVLLMTSASAYACSCKKFWIEDIANQKNLLLTKIQILQRSSSTHKVKVLEDIKGNYPYDYIDVNEGVTNNGSCGVTIKENSEIYVVNEVINKKTSHDANVCNIVSQQFAESVKSYIKQPKLELQSVDVTKWVRIFNDKSAIGYADSQNIRKDEYGSYIWVLVNKTQIPNDNFTDSVKSKKIQLQFACKEMKYNIVAKHEFSDYNANGFVVKSRDYAKYDSYEWLDVGANYAKVMALACK